MSPCSNTVINCYNNGTIRLWDAATMAVKKTLPKVHCTYTYKLRSQGATLYSCSHDHKVVLTDLETCEQALSLAHPNSVWGIHLCSQNEVASVGLFGAGCVWDVRIGRRVQSWELPAGESSFVTAQNSELLMGDAQVIKGYERRVGKVVVRGTALLSTEAILMLEGEKVVQAGRGGEIAVFSTKTPVDVDLPPHNAVIMLPDNVGGVAGGGIVMHH